MADKRHSRATVSLAWKMIRGVLEETLTLGRKEEQGGAENPPRCDAIQQHGLGNGQMMPERPCREVTHAERYSRIGGGI